jgi:hypothetical protein
MASLVAVKVCYNDVRFRLLSEYCHHHRYHHARVSIANLNCIVFVVVGAGTNACFMGSMAMAVAPSGTVVLLHQASLLMTMSSTFLVSNILAGGGSDNNADGVGTNAGFAASGYQPIALDASASKFFLADTTNHKVRVINASTLTVSTLSGNGMPGSSDGLGTNVRFYQPYSVTVDTSGRVYVGDSTLNQIRKLFPIAGVTTACVAGSYQPDPSSSACLPCPSGAFCPVNTLIIPVPCPLGSRLCHFSSPYNSDFCHLIAIQILQIENYCFSDSLLHKYVLIPRATFFNTNLFMPRSFSKVATTGYYCPGSVSAPIVCPSRYICSAAGLSSPSLCPAGSFCNAPGLLNVSGSCSAGYYWCVFAWYMCLTAFGSSICVCNKGCMSTSGTPEYHIHWFASCTSWYSILMCDCLPPSPPPAYRDQLRQNQIFAPVLSSARRPVYRHRFHARQVLFFCLFSSLFFFFFFFFRMFASSSLVMLVSDC